MKSNPSDNLMEMKAKTKEYKWNKPHVDKFEKKKFCQNEMFKVEIQTLHWHFKNAFCQTDSLKKVLLCEWHHHWQSNTSI